MIDWDNARQVKKITNSNDAIILYYIDDRGYVLSDGYNTDWLNESVSFYDRSRGVYFLIDNFFNLTPKQIEQVKKSYNHDKNCRKEKMDKDKKEYIKRELDKVWLDGDIKIKVTSENNETKWISLDNTKVKKILKAITN